MSERQITIGQEPKKTPLITIFDIPQQRPTVEVGELNRVLSPNDQFLSQLDEETTDQLASVMASLNISA